MINGVRDVWRCYMRPTEIDALIKSTRVADAAARAADAAKKKRRRAASAARAAEQAASGRTAGRTGSDAVAAVRTFGLCGT